MDLLVVLRRMENREKLGVGGRRRLYTRSWSLELVKNSVMIDGF
jgi:hypothetical protein